ncbi:MAG: hypothetical protein ACO1OB_04545 [Archangium sp.]
MKRLVISAAIVGALLAGAAHAQSPDEEWTAPPPVAQPQAVPAPEPLPPAPVPVAQPMPMPAPMGPRPEVLARVRPKQERNERSVWGATPLGHGNRGQSVMMGFPLLDVRALFGLGDRVDLGLGFDSYFFMMNQPKGIVRVNLVRTETLALSAQLEGGYAFFVQRATLESRGARWLTGRRNVNINPSLVLSLQGPAPRAPRIYFAAHYLMTLDFEGYASSPLGGIPPAIIVGHNGGIRGGAELPLSSRTSFLFMFGLDIHGRDVDSVVMPTGGLGVVTSL